MSAPTIVDVRSWSDRRRTLALVAAPYAADPHWVHPDVRVLKSLVRGRGRLAARCEHRSLLVFEGGRAVACLTVFVHRSFEEKHGVRIATIGFFEALAGHDQAVDRLFAAAEAWAIEHGARRIWGPMNGHIMYGFGCLDGAYDESPVVGTAYNPPEYPGHWWRQGFKQAPSFYSYRVDLTRAATRAAIDAAAANARLDVEPAITIRPADLREWRREVAIFIDLHNAAFEKNWGDTPLSHEEMWELMGLARLTTDPELFLIAESRGRPVGMVLGMPDFNQAFRRVRGEPAGLKAGLALLFFHRSIRRGGLFAIGVLPEARGRGLAETLAARAMRRMAERGLVEMEYCLVLEDNVPSQRIAQRFGGEHTKTHRMFEKVLDGR